MTNYREFEAYIESLCVSHKDVLHDPADGGVKAFARLLDHEAINQIPNNAGKCVVIFENVQAKTIGDFDSNKYQQTFVITFLSKSNSIIGNPASGIDLALYQSWNVMMQFLAKMRIDYLNDSCGLLNGTDFNFSWQMLEDEQLTDHVGWELTVKHTSLYQVFDPTKWQ